MKRPAGFTFLALVFGWLAIGGFVFAWSSQTVEPAQITAFYLRPAVLAAIGISYGLAASATAIALWRVAAWASRAILIWGASLLATMIALQAMIGVAGEPWWLVALPYVFFGALVFALLRYVGRRSQSVVRAI